MQGERVLSGWWLRVAAFLIDFVLAAGVAFGLLFLGDAITGARDNPLFVVLFWLVVLLYSPILVARGGAHNGQTIGRQVAGIRVVREDGGAVGFGPALGRHLLHGLLWIIPLVGLLNDLWPLWDPQNQTWHDKAAATLVTVAGPQ